MQPGLKILVVAPTTGLASTLVTWLSLARHELVVATTFAAAKAQLDRRPDLLITEVKLGEYNGLHLALRSRAAGIPAILVGDSDCVVEREAAQFGATYLTAAALKIDELQALVRRLVEGVLSIKTGFQWPDVPSGAPFFPLPLISTH